MNSNASHRFAAAVLASATLALAASPAAEAASAISNAFNPAVSLVLDGRFARFSEDPAEYELPGFQLGGEAGVGDEGIGLGESELNISANVDDWFYGNMTASIVQEDGESGIELEEAWIQTLAMPGGISIKLGKFLSRTGYLNEKHAHAWDFEDAPLVYRAFFGDTLKDSGVQLRWVAPTDLFLEFGAELLRGDAFPASGAADRGQGLTTAFVKLGGDAGVSNSWQLGLSWIDAQAEFRTSAAYDLAGVPQPELAFSGDSTMTGVDFVWKWAPNGNFKDRNLVFVTEYWQRDEDGLIDTDFGGGPETGAYSGTQDGWYAQAAWQFVARWRVGLRYDALGADNTVTGLSQLTVLDRDAFAPTRTSVMLDYSNSEFSRLRLQVNSDESNPAADTQVMLQYIVSIGAHGAHQF